jgi:hypothetical protein
MCSHQYQQELQRRPLPTLWEIPDQMWNWIQFLFPPEKETAEKVLLVHNL